MSQQRQCHRPEQTARRCWLRDRRCRAGQRAELAGIELHADQKHVQDHAELGDRSPRCCADSSGSSCGDSQPSQLGRSSRAATGRERCPASTSPITGGWPSLPRSQPNSRPRTMTAARARSRWMRGRWSRLDSNWRSLWFAQRRPQAPQLAARSYEVAASSGCRTSSQIASIAGQTSSTSSLNRSPISRSVTSPFRCGMLLHEPAEAEAVVELADQPPHPVHALHEARLPLAELRRRGVALGQPLGDRVGRQLARLERQQHARRIERIEEAERIADQHPAVAGRLLRAVRVFLRGAERRARAWRSRAAACRPGQRSTSSK